MSLLNKPEIRKQIRALRCALPALYRDNASVMAAHLLTPSPFFQASHHVACYMAFGEEINVMPIIEAAWQAGKECYLPVVKPATRTLEFVKYCEHDTLVKSHYGTLEPAGNDSIALSNLDLVIMPLLAFDKAGNRLGTGGGYYDRTFAGPRGKTRFVGIGFKVQQVEKIPTESFDVKMDAMVTEENIIISTHAR